jgi:hypothetical protein
MEAAKTRQGSGISLSIVRPSLVAQSANGRYSSAADLSPPADTCFSHYQPNADSTSSAPRNVVAAEVLDSAVDAARPVEREQARIGLRFVEAGASVGAVDDARRPSRTALLSAI